MFFAQPFILASEFVHHVALLVLCGLVATEYGVRIGDTEKSRKERALFGIIGIVVLLTAFGVIVEYFIPGEIMQFHLLVQVPLTVTIIAFMFRIDVSELPRAFTLYRGLLVGLSLFGLVLNGAQILFAYRESELLRSVITTIEVFGLYGFVLHYVRHFTIPKPLVAYVPGSTKLEYLRSSSMRAAAVCVLLFGFAAPASAFSLTAHIDEQSMERKAGERVYFDVDIAWPENNRRQDVRVEYQIVDRGQVIAREKVLRAVTAQASFLDYLVVPTHALAGAKELRVIVETYDRSLSESASSPFTVVAARNTSLMYFIILASASALIVLMVVFQVVMRLRAERALVAEQGAN